MRSLLFLLALFFGLCAFVEETRAEEIVVVIENTMAPGEFFLTPFWIAAQNGDFDVWSGGQLASNFPGLEEIAEEGDTSPLSAAFLASSAGAAGGVDATLTAENIAAPVFSPGEARTYLFDVPNPETNQFFSYASMVIPSNDLFVAVSVPTTHQIFDSSGEFLGPLTIEIRGSDVVDAGTEVNDINGGAAFSANGGMSLDESNVLADIYDLDPNGEYLNTILETTTVTGAVIQGRFEQDQLIARITIKRRSAPLLTVNIENTSSSDGFFLTPFWVAAFDGIFDVWSGGQFTSSFPGLQELAEEGDTGPISAAFAASSSGLAGGVDATIAANDIAPGVFSPGESAQFLLDPIDASTNRYFSYASMIIPSNDLFAAVSVPTTHELFDSDGNFLGPITIEIRGSDVVDAGTEVNDIFGGAAFSAEGGIGLDESNVLADIYDIDPSATYLGSIVGTETVTGDLIGSIFGPDDVIAVITVDVLPEVEFVRGDVDADGSLGISDPIGILATLFQGAADFACEKSADVNDSNVVDLADTLVLLHYLFLAGAPPVAPFPSCGLDDTPDLLECAVFPACP